MERAAGGQPRPVADATCAAARRPAADRAGAAAEYLEQARKFVEDRGRRPTSRPTTCCAAGRGARRPRPIDPMRLRRPSWTGSAKLRLLEGYRERDGLELGRAAAAAGRPAVLRRAAGQGALQPAGRPRARCSGCSPTTRSTPGDDRRRRTDTRAYFRGECLRAVRRPRSPRRRWDSVIFDVGRESLRRVPTLEPLRGTRAHVGALFEPRRPAQELVDTITGG